MRNHPLPLFALCAGAALWLSGPAQATTHVFDFANLNLAIPDGSSVGTSLTRSLGLPSAPIAKVSVSLTLLPRDGSLAFNGDLYAALTHGSGYSVLLNRAGRRAGSGLGYADNGFDVQFDDAADHGDVHAYRYELGGSHSSVLEPAPLTGVWAPDGRAVNPASALLADPRTALLSTFNGMDASGDWTLFVADWENGGWAKLDRWSIEITLVPEPAAIGMAAALGLAALAVFRGPKRRSR